MLIDSLPYIALAFVLGIVAAYLFLRGRIQSVSSDLASERMRSAELETENKRIEPLEKGREQLYKDIKDLGNDCATLNERANLIPDLKNKIESHEKTLTASQNTNADLRAEIAQLKEARKNDSRLIDELKEVRKNFEDTFTIISKNALKENRDSFARESLDPVKAKLEEFAKMVDLTYKTEAAERNSLRGEIKNLVELNQQISKEASNLALALKGDTKKQGNWGELILEKVLEFCGLRKGSEYKLQVSMKDGDGSRVQPDAIVYLPENKHILIDAKVSLVAYDRYISSVTDSERNVALADHISSVKKHIKELSEKDYSSLPELDSPDFTLLFMPIESSFGLAIQADNELFAYAWDRKIVIVSPSTLLATLRTIASIWKQERQTKNALDIADRAGKMYDKFVGFVDDMINVGKKMDDAKTSYSGAMNKLSTGAGNLVRQSEQLKDMGAKATKQLPATLLDRATEAISIETVAAGPVEKLLERA